MKIPCNIIIIAATAMLFLGACKGGNDANVPSDAIVSVGKEHLRRADLQRALPVGMNEADSTTFARAFIRAWIDGKLIQTKAADQVDMAQIEKLTEEYRQELIMAQYRRSIARKAFNGIFSPDSIQRYYNDNMNQFVLERPMIKGVYLKVPDDSPQLATIRKLYKSTRPVDLDRLEKAVIGSAIHYDYFRDRWIDIEQVENLIPADISSIKNADHKPLDVSVGGFTYLLQVTDYLAAGSPMPIEAAEPLVRERLLAAKRIAYDQQLRNDLLNKAISDGTVSFPGQNPLK